MFYFLQPQGNAYLFQRNSNSLTNLPVSQNYSPIPGNNHNQITYNYNPTGQILQNQPESGIYNNVNHQYSHPYYISRPNLNSLNTNQFSHSHSGPIQPQFPPNSYSSAFQTQNHQPVNPATPKNNNMQPTTYQISNDGPQNFEPPTNNPQLEFQQDPQIPTNPPKFIPNVNNNVPETPGQKIAPTLIPNTNFDTNFNFHPERIAKNTSDSPLVELVKTRDQKNGQRTNQNSIQTSKPSRPTNQNPVLFPALKFQPISAFNLFSSIFTTASPQTTTQNVQPSSTTVQQPNLTKSLQNRTSSTPLPLLNDFQIHQPNFFGNSLFSPNGVQPLPVLQNNNNLVQPNTFNNNNGQPQQSGPNPFDNNLQAQQAGPHSFNNNGLPQQAGPNPFNNNVQPQQLGSFNNQFGQAPLQEPENGFNPFFQQDDPPEQGPYLSEFDEQYNTGRNQRPPPPPPLHPGFPFQQPNLQRNIDFQKRMQTTAASTFIPDDFYDAKEIPLCAYKVDGGSNSIEDCVETKK